MAVPGGLARYWQTTGQHEADAGVVETFELDPAQTGALPQALAFVGLPLVSNRGTVLARGDQVTIDSRRRVVWQGRRQLDG